MRVDAMTFPEPLSRMGGVARRTQSAGFDGMLVTEGGRSAFTALTAAVVAAPDLDYSTGVAVAFPRSPMVTAQAAWELQEATGGRFRLGLGTQVRTHVVRRYGVEFEHPGPRLRDYVLAVKACFEAFRGEPLDHRGDFYELTFLNRQWSPGPIEARDPLVDIAAVNPWMLRMAGEVADGVHVHPIGEPGYLARHVEPQVRAGAEAAGRDVDDVAVIVPVTTIVGSTDEEIDAARTVARTSLSFYGSTPNYAFIWDEAGFEGTTSRLRAKQKAGDFTGMTGEITDEHLAAFCTEATWDGLADALVERYSGVADRLVLYSAGTATPEAFERYGEVARVVSDRTGPHGDHSGRHGDRGGARRVSGIAPGDQASPAPPRLSAGGMATRLAEALVAVGFVVLSSCASDGSDVGTPPAPTDPNESAPAEEQVSATEAPTLDRVAAVAAAVDIRADGCGPRVGFGTGSLIGDRTVTTAAHVVAGAGSIEVIAADGSRTAGDVVLFDPDLDLAVIRTDASIGMPLTLRTDGAFRGEMGIVVLPRLTGGEMIIEIADVMVLRPANIRTTDIYLDQPVERAGFEIVGSIDPGDSGAMVVLPGGGVGIVWARSNVNERHAWAIDLPATLLDGDALRLTEPVDVGPCIR